MACSGRHHRWAANPPPEGTRCIRCPAVFVSRRAGVGVKLPPTPIDVPVSPAARPSWTEALKRLAPAPVAEAPGSAVPEVPIPPPRPILSGWTKIVGPRLAHVVLNLTERMAEYTSKKGQKFEAGELEDETREYCDEAMSVALASWFPDAALTPGKQLIVAFGLAFGEQWVGRREIAPAVDEPKPTAAPVADSRPPEQTAPVSKAPETPPTPPFVGGIG